MIALVLTTAIGFDAHGQQDQPEPTHGGNVVEAGEYHIELVLVGDEMHFYLLGPFGKELPSKGIIGTANIHFVDQTTTIVEIRPKKDGTLHAVLRNPSAFSVMASLMVDGKFVSARFESGPRDSATAQPNRHGIEDGHQH